MKHAWLQLAMHLLAVVVAGTVTSALASDRQDQPLFAGSSITRSISSGLPPSQVRILQHMKQQASPQTILHMSSLGPQRYVYTYYPGGLVETERIQCHKSGTWNDSLRTTWTYTAAGRMKTEYVEQYLQGAFRSLRRWSVEYNDAGDVVSSLNEQGSWVLAPSSRMLYTYASPGKAQTVTVQTWSGGWVNSWQWDYSWNGMGQMVANIAQQWTQGRWDTTQMTVSTYSGTLIIDENRLSRYRTGGVWGDSSKMLLRTDDANNTYLFEQSDWTNGVLTMANRTTNTFDGAHRIIRSVDEELRQGVMATTQRMTFSYDHDGNELLRTREYNSTGNWVPGWRLTSTYDGAGKIQTCEAEQWEGSWWAKSDGSSLTDSYAAMYYMDAVGNHFDFRRFATLTFDFGGIPTDVPGGSTEQPLTWELSQNYPNPFNPSTTIRYGLPARSQVTLTVFNTLGQQVAVLQNGEQDAGYHEAIFNAQGLSSGVYFCRMQAGSFVETKKLLLEK